MKLILFKNKNKRLKTIELYGLSRSGKTELLKRLIKKGNKDLLPNNFPRYKIFLFLLHLIKNPIKTINIFYKTNANWIILDELKFSDYFKIFILRNSYLSAVFSKYEFLKKCKEKVFVDEFLIQSLQIILQKKSSEKEILKILRMFPFTGEILLVESSLKKRYERIKKTRFPGEQINRGYAIAWMKNTEYNYNIIKKLLKKEYGPIEKISEFKLSR